MRPAGLSRMRSSGKAARQRRRGFTLLEMALAIALLVMLCVFMFGFYWSILRSREKGTKAIEGTQLARVVAERIAEEIRGASNSLAGGSVGISGKEHEITLNTIVLTDDNLLQRRSITDVQLQPQSDVREIRYYLSYDPDKKMQYPDGTEAPQEIGLVRREIRTPRQKLLVSNQLQTVDTDLLAKELMYLRFRYFDGVDWLKKWDLTGAPGQNPLPQAVEVTVGYTPLPPDDPTQIDLEQDQESNLADPEPYDRQKFVVVVRIPMADVFMGSRLLIAQNGIGGGSSAFGGPGGSALSGGKFTPGLGQGNNSSGGGNKSNQGGQNRGFGSSGSGSSGFGGSGSKN